MNKYLEKIAVLNSLKPNRRKGLTQTEELDRQYIDHPSNSERDNLLETEEANRIAGDGQ